MMFNRPRPGVLRVQQVVADIRKARTASSQTRNLQIILLFRANYNNLS